MTEPRLPNAPRPYISAKTAAAVAKRDQCRCRYCGTPTGPFDLDHVFPFAQGGSSGESNLAYSCRPCNAIAGDRVFPEIEAKIVWLQAARKALPADAVVALVKGMYGDDGA